MLRHALVNYGQSISVNWVWLDVLRCRVQWQVPATGLLIGGQAPEIKLPVREQSSTFSPAVFKSATTVRRWLASRVGLGNSLGRGLPLAPRCDRFTVDKLLPRAKCNV